MKVGEDDGAGRIIGLVGDSNHAAGEPFIFPKFFILFHFTY